ncbi:MAG: M1 family metallopeptidase [Bacteroidia bacterium]|nr:M1 family metallopeptidase [Bacteroidia bacterium]
MKFQLSLLFLLCAATLAFGQDNKFLPMDAEWPTPDLSRTATGAPGPDYWQQQADYKIAVTLHEKERSISGTETISYQNNSPFSLSYLWVQADQNCRRPDSEANLGEPNYGYPERMGTQQLAQRQNNFQGGMKLEYVRDGKGKALPFTLSGTNFRIDLPEPLLPGKKMELQIAWSYPINDATLEGRSGYEDLDGKLLFEIAQFYPRMCTFDNVKGWQNMPFLGPGEFSLEFGNFEVSITAPANHLVPATGELQNPNQVLSAEMRQRLASLAETPGEVKSIVTNQEAFENEKSETDQSKTWVYKARNVRDFAFASSKTFIWDAAQVNIEGKPLRVQSFYPALGGLLWTKFATHAAIHTLNTYSKYTFPYPYPQATVVHGAVWGMEYPMMAFCGGRPSKPDIYSRQEKYAMISVVMHEVGHNFFPMIVNSDERRWAWMDEGLNSFLQFLTEQEFEPDYPARRGVPDNLTDYLQGNRKNPIMTNVESIRDNGGTSYHKTAVGLNMLRETIIGRKLFDQAFRAYAQRWMFKRPEPADFFRTMEDVSGVDLDWFWRAWFYGTDEVDISVEGVVRYKLDGNDPGAYLDKKDKEEAEYYSNLTISTNHKQVKTYYADKFPNLKDNYSIKEEQELTPEMKARYDQWVTTLPEASREAIQKKLNFYQISFENKGGCPMPILFSVKYADGSWEEFRIPASIWRLNHPVVRKEVVSEKELVAVLLDPHRELPDTDRSNNHFPRKIEEKSIQLVAPGFNPAQNDSR